ncbi:hypothetical protein [Streptomyces sp. NPDC001381]|uniref:hypothetical protein n=1 Tax=Streptomyces sp. NPDC001381 TaxID=3364567 RepID=UPI0036BCD58B
MTTAGCHGSAPTLPASGHRSRAAPSSSGPGTADSTAARPPTVADSGRGPGGRGAGTARTAKPSSPARRERSRRGPHRPYGPVTVDQALFARFVERAGDDRLPRRCRRACRERRDALVDAPREHLSGTRVSGFATRVHVIAELRAAHGPGRSSFGRMAAAGVRVRALEEYAHARGGRDNGTGGHGGAVRLVLGYAQVSPTRIRTAYGR